MSEKKFIKFLIVMTVIGLLFVAYGRYIVSETIKSAQLIEVTDEGYLIDFDGQVHEYTFD